MKTDMYNPANGSHYMASSSQIPILERSGWVIYSVWLAQQSGTGTTTTSTAAPAPTTTTTSAPADTSTTSSTDTVPAPTL